MSELARAYSTIVSTWRKKRITTRSQLEDELIDYPIVFAYHSGKIENDAITYHDTRDIFEKGETRGFSGNICTLFEILNLKACNDFLMERFDERAPISEELLLSVHKALTTGTYDPTRWAHGERPGAYKLGDYVVGVADTGVPANDVPDFVRSLLGEIEVANPDNVLTVASYFHGSLEVIHPFADGNGRVGRALLNYLFLLNDHPPIVIREEDRLAYYGALDAWDRDADLEPLKTFLMAEAVKTWGGKR